MRTRHSTPLLSATTSNSKATFSPPTFVQRSPWHSPVPYLFGGLVAMLGLIAFALLILACSYWKISSSAREDAEKGDGGSHAKAPPVLEMKFLVIMAGDVKPTFLATPKTCCSSDDEKADQTPPENGDDQCHEP